MNKSLVIAILALSATPAMALDVQYDKMVGLAGTLVERKGVDCCTNGKEKTVTFPALQLDQPINASSANAQNPDPDEVPEQGVRVMQLVLKDKAQWSAFKQLKGKRVRVECTLFHAATGHHLTPVLCDVIGIGAPDSL
ncbi:DUF4431 domain-containing protein [Chromobacterium subtsugae]|uniref:DUF4431 domain-containing protein n=1 Tax=Chromobacterium subtsugae TaxID=251747 RepID=UPI0012FFA498|nr:DUF4431 domain-containing protein [Chromobacterium subtsugae]